MYMTDEELMQVREEIGFEDDYEDLEELREYLQDLLETSRERSYDLD